MEENKLETITQNYLQAYDQRDLPACISFFAPDAVIHFAMGVYRGTEAIEGWHQDRFDADFRVIKVERIRLKRNKVIIDGVISSKVGRSWGFETLAGTGTFFFENEKIKQMKFGLRVSIPLEGW